MATVLIDLDGTLVPHTHWEPVFLEASREVAKRASIPPAEVWKAVRQKSIELIRRLDYRGFDWQHVFQQVAHSLDAGDPPDLVKILEKHLHTFTTFDGAHDALRRLKEAGYRVEIATNGHTYYQLPVIKALALDKLVDGIRTSDMYKCPKTCPQYFEGGDLIVGDNPIFDIYFPKKFGLLTVLYGRWEKARETYQMWIDLVEPDRETERWPEVPTIVRQLLATRPTP
ncbi:MAG: HAD family hydrolase [Pyrobaculum sp.]